MLTNLKRVLKFAWTDFSRSKGNNFAAIFVLALPIILATGLFLFQGMATYLVGQVQDKIDITAYFKDTVDEESILSVKSDILNISDSIEAVQYVSKEEALTQFRERHKNEPDFLQALDELGSNPFLASLVIKTSEPALYEVVTDYLSTGDRQDLIDNVDYSQKKGTIEKVYSITSNVNNFGLALSLILFSIAILVVLNTIKLAIDNSKDEIESMKMVGASNWFIRGPFIVQGAICGIAAFLFCIIITSCLTYLISPKLGVLAPGFDLMSFFLGNIWTILAIQIGAGVGLGIIASFVLVRSYLKT